MIALLLVLQSGWTATPAQPTVGDTIHLERRIATAPGWRVRAGKLESSGGALAEPLAGAVVLQAPDGWAVRYAVVAWTPGTLHLDMPPVWRLGPDGTADSLPGGTATFQVASVIPDSIPAPQPQPALGPLRLSRPNPLPPAAAVALAAAMLIALVSWRRRQPRSGLAPAAALAVDRMIPDERWLAAGEPKAVAARASHNLREAIAHAIPDAHAALSTAECLTVVERARPQAPLRELRDVLGTLDHVAFATAHGVEVGPLAARARALAREFAANGKAPA